VVETTGAKQKYLYIFPEKGIEVLRPAVDCPCLHLLAHVVGIARADDRGRKGCAMALDAGALCAVSKKGDKYAQKLHICSRMPNKHA